MLVAEYVYKFEFESQSQTVTRMKPSNRKDVIAYRMNDEFDAHVVERESYYAFLPSTNIRFSKIILHLMMIFVINRECENCKFTKQIIRMEE